MYLNGKKIKRMMRQLGLNHNQFAVFCNVGSSTIWNLITLDKCNVTADTSLKIYRFLKLEGLASNPLELLDHELIEKEVEKGI